MDNLLMLSPLGMWSYIVVFVVLLRLCNVPNFSTHVVPMEISFLVLLILVYLANIDLIAKNMSDLAF